MATADPHNRAQPSLRYRQRRKWWQYWEDPSGLVPDPVARLTMPHDTRTTLAGDRRIAYVDYVPAPVPPDHPHAQKVRVTADGYNTRTTMAGDRRLTNGRRIG